MAASIDTLLTDVGGVLLTNGWDHEARARAIAHFNLDAAEVDERHRQSFETYELGKITLDEYLKWVVFYREQPFSPDDFKQFMFAQSQPYPQMLALLRDVRRRYGLKIVVVSNEGRELTKYRIQQFHLDDFVDVYLVSGYVRLRKPDPDIYRLAVDVAMVSLDRCLYLEDRPLFVEVAREQGIPSLRHESYEATKAALAARGLTTTG